MKPQITLLIPASWEVHIPSLERAMRALTLVEVMVGIVLSEDFTGWSLVDAEGEHYEADYTVRGVVVDAFRRLGL